MEFVTEVEDVLVLLKNHGITQGDPEGAESSEIRLRMADGDEVTFLHLAAQDCSFEPMPGARTVELDIPQLAEFVEEIIHRLHLSPVLLVPVGKWRDVFDAVAFSLASNEDWQEVDAAATVELNRRDPLLCEPKDYHTVGALVRAVLADAETPRQGLIVTSTAAPLLLEVVPGGAVRVAVGSRAIADEIEETLGADAS